MRIEGKTYAVTGAARGLGAAIAITLADHGAIPVLLGRSRQALEATAQLIKNRSDMTVDTIVCDLSSVEGSKEAAENLSNLHPALDGLVNNGAMWLPGSLSDISDAEIEACIASASIGTLVLTRHLLPVLKSRPHADIHTVVSTSGLVNVPLHGVSVAFRAAKAAQSGLVEGLYDELRDTCVRVSAVYPDEFEDISPTDSAWNTEAGKRINLSNRQVVEAILFALNLPPGTVVQAMTLR